MFYLWQKCTCIFIIQDKYTFSLQKPEYLVKIHIFSYQCIQYYHIYLSIPCLNRDLKVHFAKWAPFRCLGIALARTSYDVTVHFGKLIVYSVKIEHYLKKSTKACISFLIQTYTTHGTAKQVSLNKSHHLTCARFKSLVIFVTDRYKAEFSSSP